MTLGQFLKRSLTGLNSDFSFSETSCLTKAEEPSLPYYLPIAGGRIIGFIPFPRVLVLCEMQSVLSRNWTRIAVSISCDDNHYTTGTCKIANFTWYFSIFHLGVWCYHDRSISWTCGSISYSNLLYHNAPSPLSLTASNIFLIFVPPFTLSSGWPLNLARKQFTTKTITQSLIIWHSLTPIFQSNTLATKQ